MTAGDTEIPPRRRSRLYEAKRDASCRHRRRLAQHGGDLPPAINPAQFDLAADDEAEEQDYGGVFARQGALCLHAPAELFEAYPRSRKRSFLFFASPVLLLDGLSPR